MTVPGEGHMTTLYRVGERKSRVEGTSRDPSSSHYWGLGTWVSCPTGLYPVGAEASPYRAVRGLLGSTEDLDFPGMR